ncbi:MAG: hypothetical protein Q9209_000839 [Squamulea sp. 1 TL-2023]
MGPDVIAAIAALVVAFVAFLAASAQAIQQYLVSGQLIRLCDSVVYNQMPGQGRRIWQFSQFRFRVVYSIPQVRLLPDLWLDVSAHVRPLPPDAATLPNLRAEKPTSTSAALAGEASWVSFVRAVQYTAGRSLRYIMVEGDADRCPSDLPVVPMQLSMRDVVVTALSAGMECTDISFQSQSISMQGDAGTITSSRHPVLGALIHYAPNQALECHGIQVSGGTIHGDWVVRMLDVVTVAGFRFDLVDRKHYEEDEGSWMKAFQSKVLNCIEKREGILRIPPSSTVRKRHPMRGSAADHGKENSANKGTNPVLSVGSLKSSEKEGSSAIQRPQDGMWHLVSEAADPITDDAGVVLPIPLKRPTSHGSSIRPYNTLALTRRQVRRAKRRSKQMNTKPILPVSEPTYNVQDNPNHSQQSIAKHETMVDFELKPDLLGPSPHDRSGLSAPSGESHRNPEISIPTPQLDDGEQDGIPKHLNRRSSHIQTSPRIPLLLTDGSTYVGQTSAPPEGLVSPGWDKEMLQDQARHKFVIDKWQQTFQQRRKERSRGRSQNDRDGYSASRRRAMRASIRQGSSDEARGTKLGESIRQRKLAIQERRQKSISKLSGNVVLGNRQDHRYHASSSPEYGSDEALSHHGYTQSDSRQGTKGWSSSSSLLSERYGRPKATADEVNTRAAASMYERASARKSRFPVERGRRRNSELYREMSGTYVMNAYSRPQAYGGSEDNPIQQSLRATSTSIERGRKTVRVLDPGQDDSALVLRQPSPSSPLEEVMPGKPALRPPTKNFPEDPDFVRPGVAAAESARRSDGIPEWARWTKIDRKIVDAEVLERGRERYEEREDYIIILRVLSKKEVEQYAAETQEFRAQQHMSSYRGEEFRSISGNDASSEDSDDSQESFVRRRDSEAETSTTAFQGLDSQITRPNNHHDSQSEDIDESTGSTGSTYNRSVPSIGTGQRSIPRQQSLKDVGILTYAEEIMFLQSDHILKKLAACTEQCKDVATTLQFVRSVQPDLGSNMMDIYEIINDTNTSVKAVLIHIGPLRENKRIADIILRELDTLFLGLRSSLDVLQTNFDLFDITSLTFDERRAAWASTLTLFESRHGCPMMDYLGIIRSFSVEIASNFQAGIFTSPEADLLKERLSKAIDNRRATSVSASAPENFPQRNTSQFRSRYFLSPSRFTDSPLHSPMKQGFHDSSMHDKVPKNEPWWSPGAPESPKPPTSSSHSRTDTDNSSGDETDMSTPTSASSKTNYTGKMKWFWICQADVLPGYFATPWRTVFSYAECIGTISVILKSLESFTNSSNFRYVPIQYHNRQWIRLGYATYPSYAHKAAGGVVVAGTYKASVFDAFGSLIAPLELLQSYEYQVNRNFVSSAQAVIDSTAEIMGLDSWLSVAGRQSEIFDGPSILLRTLPTLIQQIATDFHLEFSSVDRTSKDGGSRIIETISESLLGYLKEQNLSDAEQLFCIVALLRAAKMALCVARGTDTAMLREVLVHDVQVYLA